MCVCVHFLGGCIEPKLGRLLEVAVESLQILWFSNWLSCQYLKTDGLHTVLDLWSTIARTGNVGIGSVVRTVS